MPDSRTYGSYAPEYSRARSISSTQLLGQVMFLVAIAIGFLALGSYLGRDISLHTARILSFVGFGMLLVSSFAGRTFRVGAFAMGWLFATATMIGLGLGPVISYFATTNNGPLVKAIVATAGVVAIAGATGFALSKDLKSWMRPLSWIILGLIAVSLLAFLFGSGGNPILSLAIGIVSALLIVVDFNYLRKHATEDDTIWLATGIFVSIVNIFLSLLNIFSR